jgi:hypothetical protein
LKKSSPQLKKLNLERPFPYCIPDSTFGVSLFWAEEYWAWKKIQKIKETYPNINLKGIINSEFENILPSMITKLPHNLLKDTKNYENLYSNPWEIDYELINLATSHAPSRIKANKFLQDYPENLIIISFDAHYDIGGSGIIHGAWLTEELLKRTAIIGGWSESKFELLNLSNKPIIYENELEIVLNDSKFRKWIREKFVYITFDLDYFRNEKKFEGLSSYWHRNLINGHSMNLFQEIEVLTTKNISIDKKAIGAYLGFFQNLSDFQSNKQKSIFIQINYMIDILGRFFEVLKEESVVLLNLDIVEYSPLCDWKNLTIKELIKVYDSIIQFVS